MILRLAHVEIAVDDLAAARAFYVDLLGFVEHARDDRALYLRGAEEFDAWSLKVSAGTGPGGGLVHSAFRVAAPGDLDEIEGIQRRLGLPVLRVPGAPSSRRERRSAPGRPTATASSSSTTSRRSRSSGTGGSRCRCAARDRSPASRPRASTT